MDDAFRSPRRYGRIAFALISSAGALAPAASGAVHRLSDGQSFSTIELTNSKPALTPDGERVVYCQNAEAAGAFALWSVRLAGGAPVRLSGALAGGGLACWFRISPDGTRVVYLANQDAPSTYELYSVPVDGSALPVKLNPALIANGNVSPLFEISPDSSTVVYRADQVLDDRFEIWSVPIGGGAAVQVNGNLTSGGDVTSFEISPTGLQVIYLADQLNDEVFQVYGASIAGEKWGTLISAGLAAGDILEFKLTQDGSRVVARGDRDVDDRFQLYRATTDGAGGVTTLGVTPVVDGDVLAFAISPDDQFVVYIADLNVNGVVELFSFPTDNSGGVGHQTLSGSMTAGGDVDLEFAISPDSAYVVYVADAAFDGQYEVHAVFPSGGTGFPLNASLPAGSSVAFDPLITPDSARVVYRVVGGFGLGATDIYGAPIDGGSSALLNPVPPSGSWTAQRQVAAAGGAHAFFEFQSTADSATRIYRAAVAGGELIEIGPVLDMVSGEAFSWLGPTADARQALFVSNEQTGAATELYAGDTCVLCDGFDSAGTTRWSAVLP
jgi:Tol biopolymer transport system component